MSRRRHFFALLLLVGATTAKPALAQSSSASAATQLATDFPVCNKKASDQDVDNARQKFIAARQDYEEASYDNALRRFHDAYTLDCSKPELLLIVSATYERKGDKQAALAALELYVQRVPKDAPELGTTQAKIENLKRQLAQQQQQQPTATATTAPPPAEGETSQHTIYPWLVVAGGVVAVAGGAIALAIAPKIPSNCPESSEKCIRQPNEGDSQLAKEEDTAGRGKWMPFWGVVSMVGGGVLIAGGVLWHFLEPTKPRGVGWLSPTRLSPAAAPGYGGFSYGGSF